MQRYFLDKPFDENGKAEIFGEDRKHIVLVMRMGIQDKIIAVSDGEAYPAVITQIDPDRVVIQMNGSELSKNEMPVMVTIACGLAKGDKHDLIVQKGTELGLFAMIPFKAERSIVKWDDKKGGKKIERLQKIAKQAAEQCHRTIIPKIGNPETLRQVIARSSDYDVLLFADEEDARSAEPHRIRDRVKSMHKKQKVLVVFGPEGGISRNEATELQSAGFLPVALGPRILRTETAPLYFLSAISYEFE
ncbi:16S rRNA (uracil(1498)-N(3))-methyltransferase [Sporosarcina jiandibaonis]|uniref:16S rRNA (uracil(1498)-N(3))-methyltransferase n=1 Tax=Sporosarcina jiandibaonis TaxID=2715535 RepID=UPI0015577E20|nr:16S rRNA (uracil(1498)-N(3))-methyltransferase [Sporosarcina jiandibaonis]